MESEVVKFIEVVVLIITFCVGYGMGKSDRRLKKDNSETWERLWNKNKKE